jgi:hypothetical protein
VVQYSAVLSKVQNALLSVNSCGVREALCHSCLCRIETRLSIISIQFAGSERFGHKRSLQYIFFLISALIRIVQM